MAQEHFESSSAHLAPGCGLLLYCSQCGFLIPPSKKPAGTSDGGVQCERCAPGAVPVGRKKRISSILVKPDANFLKAVDAEHERRERVRNAAQPTKDDSKVWIYSALGAGAGVAVILFILLMSSKPKVDKVANATPPVTQAPAPAPVTVKTQTQTVIEPVSRPPILEAPQPAEIAVKPEPTLGDGKPPETPTTPATPPAQSPPELSLAAEKPPVATAPVTPQPIALVETPLSNAVQGPASNKDFSAEQKQYDAAITEIRALAADKTTLAAARDRMNALQDKYKELPWWNTASKDYLTLKDSLQEETQDYLTALNKLKTGIQEAGFVSFVDKIQGDWCTKAKGLSANEGWVVLQPSSFKSQNGASMAVRPDGAILVGGSAPDTDTYVTQFDTMVSGITAIRIELLNDPSLPSGGPGRTGNGNLVLDDFDVRAMRGAKPTEFLAVPIAKVRASYSQNGYPVEHTLDRSVGSGWAVDAKPSTAIYELATPLAPSAWNRLCISMEHTFGGKHTVGCFRISVTTSPTPSTIAYTAPSVLEAEMGKGAPDGYLAGVQAVMRFADKRRMELAENKRSENARRLVSIYQRAEGAVRTLPLGRETLAKALDEAEGILLQDPELAREYTDKQGGFRYDLKFAHRSDGGVLRGDGNTLNGGLLEINYDFSKHQQEGVFAMGPGGYPAFAIDEKRGLFSIKCDGKRFYSKGTWNNMPEFHSGFYMLPETFMVETTGTLQGWSNPKTPNGASGESGLYVHAGDRMMMMFGFQIQDDHSVKVVLSGSTPKVETVSDSARFLPDWKPNEPVKLQLYCVNGVARGVASARGITATVEGKMLNFKPSIGGFYARTFEDGHAVNFVYQYLKYQGIPDRERFKQVLENERAAFARSYLLRLPGSK